LVLRTAGVADGDGVSEMSQMGLMGRMCAAVTSFGNKVSFSPCFCSERGVAKKVEEMY
jgi:hypothetical protein